MSGVQVFNPATNAVEEVDSAAAHEGFVAGKYHLPSQGEVHLSAPDGTTMIFPTSKAPDMVGKGWRFSDPKQVAQKTVEDSPLAQAQGAVEGALGELTFGGSDLAMRGMGADRELMQARRESTAGQVGKAVGLGVSMFGEPGLKLLGEGVAKAVLEHALLPTLGISAAGDAVEQAAKKILGDTVTNQAVAHTVASGLGRAAEGTAYGFGGALSEESLGDPEINAGHLLAGAGMGALVGGVAGAGLRGLSEFRAGRAHTAAREAITSSVGQKGIYGMEAPTAEEFQAAYKASTGDSLPASGLKKWGSKLQDVLDSASAVAGYDPADLEKVRSAAGQKWLRAGKQSIEEAARGFRNVIDRVSDEQAASSEAYFGGLKKGALDQIPRGSEAAVLGRVGDALDRVRGIRDRAVQDYALMGFRTPEQAEKAFGNMDALVDRVEDRLFKAAKAPRDVFEKKVVQHPLFDREAVKMGREADAAVAADRGENWAKKVGVDMSDVPESISREETTVKRLGLQDLAASRKTLPPDIAKQAFEELEDIKRRLAKPANFALGGDISDAAQKELESRFKDAYGVLQGHLEDTSVWGNMGNVQREMNDAWRARNEAFGKLKGQIKFDREGKVDVGALSSYISKLDKVRGDAAIEALDQWHAAQNAYADVIDKHFASAGIGEKSRALSKEFSTVRDALEEGAGTFNALQRLIGRRYQVFGGSGLGGGIVGGAVGAAAGPFGVAGAMAANQALQAVLDPGRRALNMAALSNATEKVQSWIDRRAGALVAGKTAVGKAISGPFGQRTLSRFTTEMLNAKTPEARRDAYDKRVEELTSLQDPRQFGDHVASQLLGVSDNMPNHAQAMTAQAAAAVRYLQSMLPAPRPGTTGDGGAFDLLHARPMPHDRDLLKFAQTDQAVQDPLSALDSAAKGYVFSHQVRALEAVHPHVLQAIRSSLAAHAGRSKAPLPTQLSRSLGQLLGGSAVPADRLNRMQQVHQDASNPQPPTGQGGRSPKVKSPRSAGMASTTDKLETYPL